MDACIHLLRNEVQRYAWGSRTAIPELLGQPSPAPEPQAELWMGAHPSAPSRIVTDAGEVPLDAWIETDPIAALGEQSVERFGERLPFLFKVIAADQPLSIQAHPSLEQARAGFARENEAGIPLDAPSRCYRDPNHKPELIYALTRFYALDGFRPVEAIVERMRTIGAADLDPMLDALEASPDGAGLSAFAGALLTSEAAPISRIVERAVACTSAGAVDASLAWVPKLAESHPGDVGVLAPFFLGYLQLDPGDALFLPSGQLHCYLGGVGVELMANSDNVLRGGLTRKHVDASELLATLRFAPGGGQRIRARSGAPGERIYETPAAEFVLRELEVEAGAPLVRQAGAGAEIALCVEGEARITAARWAPPLHISRGECVFVPAQLAHTIEGSARIFVAGVGAAS